MCIQPTSFVSPARSQCGGSRVRLASSCGCAGACFESVNVSGAEAAPITAASRMGAYTKLANVTQGDRPVYQRVGSTVAYLFYWPNTSEWRIFSNYASRSAGFKSTGNTGAACPDEATGWQTFTSGAWVSTYPISVTPAAGQTRPPTTAAPTNVGNAAAISACGPPRCTIGVHSYTTCRTHTAPSKCRMLTPASACTEYSRTRSAVSRVHMCTHAKCVP
jgi:hypothetical protein